MTNRKTKVFQWFYKMTDVIIDDDDSDDVKDGDDCNDNDFQCRDDQDMLNTNDNNLTCIKDDAQDIQFENGVKIVPFNMNAELEDG